MDPKQHDCQLHFTRLLRFVYLSEFLILVGPYARTQWFKRVAENETLDMGNVSVTKVSEDSIIFGFRNGEFLTIWHAELYLSPVE